MDRPWNTAPSNSWEYNPYQSLEAELVPVHLPSRPAPPARPLNIAPQIHPDPTPPEPQPEPISDADPLLGKLQSFDFGDFGDGEAWVDIETVMIAEHMPHFDVCTNVIDRAAERTCTEQQLISLIQSCAKFPPMLRESGIGGVVFLQFNVNEFGPYPRCKNPQGCPPPNSTRPPLTRSIASPLWFQELNKASP